ncbi:hypothetical protein CEXT_359741 [Caerostris extrusa]|uniref:Uncharacterized protein n=1 Tax=Caerostris extrusa TaxID=172846 RepID=A0AAV4P3N5_CAEEX|nr:hypothetical protein CEXT_359741 [Caerostris extrusa]
MNISNKSSEMWEGHMQRDLPLNPSSISRLSAFSKVFRRLVSDILLFLTDMDGSHLYSRDTYSVADNE